MEFLVCMLIAAILTGGRAVSDGIHAAKGTTPPHLEKARIRAERDAAKLSGAQVKPPRPGDDKPRLRDVARVFWGDALEDVLEHHDKVRAEKKAGTRPTFKQRLVRLGRLLWEPVGEKKPAEPAATGDPIPGRTDDNPDCWCARLGGLPPGHPCAVCGRIQPNADPSDIASETSTEGETVTQPITQPVTAPMASTGEAVNYETTVVELEAIIEAERAHVDQAAAAVKAIQDAKIAISNAQASYAPAAQAAASINEHLAAMNLDGETLGHTGTVADAMPPNAVDAMFDDLEGMEAAAQQQLANAEAALASAEAALATVQGKYGDAHATVAGELGGDARFLDSAGVSA